jgi:hypothetical protein
MVTRVIYTNFAGRSLHRRLGDLGEAVAHPCRRVGVLQYHLSSLGPEGRDRASDIHLEPSVATNFTVTPSLCVCGNCGGAYV